MSNPFHDEKGRFTEGSSMRAKASKLHQEADSHFKRAKELLGKGPNNFSNLGNANSVEGAMKAQHSGKNSRAKAREFDAKARALGAPESSESLKDTERLARKALRNGK